MYVTDAGVYKHRIAFGASWAAMPGADNLTKEIRTAARDRQAKYYAIVDRAGTRPLVGFMPKYSGSARVYAAAALIPLLKRGLDHAVFGFVLEPDVYAVICFVDGIPMIGYDIVGSKSEIEGRIDHFIDFLGGGSDVRFFGDKRVFEHRGESVEEFAFNFSAIDDEEISHARLRRAHPPYLLIVSFLVISSTVAGGWYAYSEYRASVQRRLSSQVVDPNTRYETNLKRMLGDVGRSARDSSRTYLSFLGSVPLFQAGWRLSSVRCQSNGACMSKWVADKMPVATFSGFVSNLPEDWKAAFKSDFQTIEVAHTLPADQAARTSLDIKDIPSAESFMIKVGTAIQVMKHIGAVMQLNPPNLFALPAVSNEQPPITESVLRSPVKEGTWSINLPMWSVDVLYGLPDNMILGSMEMNLGGRDVTLTAEGKYYVGK